jgi:hypothetical protein
MTAAAPSLAPISRHCRRPSGGDGSSGGGGGGGGGGSTLVPPLFRLTGASRDSRPATGRQPQQATAGVAPRACRRQPGPSNRFHTLYVVHPTFSI